MDIVAEADMKDTVANQKVSVGVEADNTDYIQVKRALVCILQVDNHKVAMVLLIVALEGMKELKVDSGELDLLKKKINFQFMTNVVM